MMRIWCLFFYLVFLVQGCVAAVPSSILPPSSDPAAQAAFQKGLKVYEEGRYDQALRIFQDLIVAYPGSPVLAEAQWMLARTYEQQGRFKEALTEYDALLSNFPQSPRRVEAGLRADFLSELLRESVPEKAYPVIVGFEIQDNPPLSSQLVSHRAEGFNTVVTDDPLMEKASGSMAPAELVTAAHREKLYAFARLRIHPAALFEEAGLNDLKLRLLEITIAGMDGVLFDGFVSSSEQALIGKTLDQFNRDTRSSLEPAEVLANPAVYWRWVGWRSRQMIKILKGSVTPVLKTRPHFYWGIIFPPEAITAPHQALARTGLDLLEAKQQGMDYFGIVAADENAAQTLLPEAQDLVGDPSRVIRILPLPNSGSVRPLQRSSGYGIVYLFPD
jgi:hypothetical protein